MCQSHSTLSTQHLRSKTALGCVGFKMEFMKIPADKLGAGAKIGICVYEGEEEVYRELAKCMIDAIESNNAAGRHTVMIVPVGPTGQYAFFVSMVNQNKVALDKCWFINMDEYLGEDDGYIDEFHPLSFRGFMKREVFRELHSPPPDEQLVFPDPMNPAATDELIEKLGGADLCIGGIGINGHVAFNEPIKDLPPCDFLGLSTRVLSIAPETLAVNAVSALGGAFELMPRRCVTVGMKQIAASRKVRLAAFRDWHRYAVRRAAYGEAGSDFPVSLLQGHPDAMLLITSNCARPPGQLVS